LFLSCGGALLDRATAPDEGKQAKSPVTPQYYMKQARTANPNDSQNLRTRAYALARPATGAGTHT
jgi:hypothetical protein